MSIFFSAIFISCPNCGAQVIPNAIQGRGDPDHLTARCRSCSQLIEMKKDPASGQLVAEVAKPA